MPHIVCVNCNKKIKDHIKDAYKCKCEQYVCSNHRFDHKCSYEHYAQHKSILSSRLRPVISDKIEKI